MMGERKTDPFASFLRFVSAYFQERSVNLFALMEIYFEVFEEIDVFQYLLLATSVWPKPCEQKRNPNLHFETWAKWVGGFWNCHGMKSRIVTIRKLRWQWNINHEWLKMYFLLKTGIFQCHVSFLGCNHLRVDIIWELSFLILKVRKLKKQSTSTTSPWRQHPPCFLLLRDPDPSGCPPKRETHFGGVRPWSMFKKAKRFATKGRRKGMGGGVCLGCLSGT